MGNVFFIKLDKSEEIKELVSDVYGNIKVYRNEET